MFRMTVVAVAILLAFQAEARAAGGSPKPIPSAPRAESPRMTPQQEAAASYNGALKRLEKAAKLEKEAAAAPDAKKRTALEEKARKEYDRAIKELRFAVAKDPDLFQAHGSLGYALRKTGDYPASLAAYDRALSLSPTYAPAIEYRAEACLRLNRLQEVQTAYMTLFNADRPRADELAAAMKRWVEERRQDPAGLTPAAIEEFARWVAQREEIAGRTGALSPAKDERW